MRVSIVHVDAFAEAPLGGAAALVVEEADHLDPALLPRLARELGLSSTFILAPKMKGAIHLRQLGADARELPLAAAGVVAAAHTLAALGELAGSVMVEHRQGLLSLWVEEGEVTLSLPAAHQTRLDVPEADVAAALGVKPGALARDYPLGRVKMGESFLIVPLKSGDDVAAASPDVGRLGALPAGGVYLFALRGSEARARHFRASPAGLVEEPLNGTGASALGSYLEAHARLPAKLGVRQGAELGRPGVALLTRRDGRPCLTGRAHTLYRAQLEL